MTMFSCPYTGAADLQAILDLLVAVRPADRLADPPGLVELREMLSLPETQACTRLWRDADGRLAGWALVDKWNNLWFEIAPQAAGGEVEAQMVAWGVECVRQAQASSTLDASCREDDAERIALLERHGFVQQPIRSIHMLRPLDEPIPPPQLPQGFVIRHVQGEHEAEALTALHRAAFGTDNLTVEDRLSWMRTPEYDPELDLVAVAPDGALAAYGFCSISRQENARTGRNQGYTDPIATHPHYQRRGLARALLLAGLHLLKERGAELAALGASSENAAMQQAARSAGFRVHSSRVWFAKPIPDTGAN